MIQAILLHLFCWLGSKLFKAVVIYSPQGDEGDVEAIHFGISEQVIAKSCCEFCENSIK